MTVKVQNFFSMIMLCLFCSDLFATSVPLIDSDSLWSTFNDNVDNGNSSSLSLNINNNVEWVYCLQNGALWPYVGVALDLRPIVKDLSKLSEKDSIVMYMRSSGAERVTLQLAVHDPEITTPDDPVSYRILEAPVTLTTEMRRVSLSLKQFRVAEWWKQQYRVPPEDNRLYLDFVCMVEWVMTDTGRLSLVDTLFISSLEFSSADNLFWVLIVTGLLTVAGTLLLVLQKRGGKRSEANSTKKGMQPIPLETGPSDWQRIVLYMEQHYTLSDLCLASLAKELGFSESRLSRLIRENYPSGFRSLIHDLRIREAKRLLAETDLNITEIAFKLGYATASHFNREFKARAGVNPTTFRSQGELINAQSS